MVNSVDKIYFQELAKQKPEGICRRSGCVYNDIKDAYSLSVWGDQYVINPNEFKIDRISKNDQRPHEYFYLFIIYYLLNSKDIEMGNEWISEKDIPGGVTFFRGPHAIPVHLISKRYGNDIDEFKKRCEQLGGIPVDMAGAAYAFNITSRIRVAVLYWEGDEEFPPEAKILYDKTIIEHLSLDVIFALAVEICTRIG
jgi:hypothetical protein